MPLGSFGLLLVASLHGAPPSPGGVELPPPLPVVSERTAIELEWNAPPGCPDADRFIGAVGRLLATTIDLDPTAAIAVRAEISSGPQDYELALFVETAEVVEERRLHAPNCGELGDAAALVVATAVDAARVADVLVRPPAPAAKPSPPSLPPVERRSPSAPLEAAPAEAKQPTRPRFAMDVTSGVAVGLTPRVTPWLRAEIGVALSRAKISATVGHAFARTSTDGNALGARAQLTVGGVSGCYLATRKRLTLPVCALLELGATRAEGKGPGIDARVRSQLWAGAGAAVAIAFFPIPQVGIVGGLDALVVLRRPRFHVVDAGVRRTAYEAAPAAVRAVIGLAVRLP